MEDNGHKDNESRLDRLEDAWNLMIRDHEEFRAEHKRLLIAQVVLAEKQQKTETLVHEIGEKLDALIAWSETVRIENEARKRESDARLDAFIAHSDQLRRENEERFRRLEDKH